MPHTVAVGDVDLSDPAAQPSDLGRFDALQPEMGDVDRRRHPGEPDLVEQPQHRIEAVDEREAERQELDRYLDVPRGRVLSDLPNGIDEPGPLPVAR